MRSKNIGDNVIELAVKDNVVLLDENKKIAINALFDIVNAIRKDEIEYFVAVYGMKHEDELVTVQGNTSYDQLCQVIGHLQAQCVISSLEALQDDRIE